ncbi:hypothetical protein PDE_04288 [Penicillium oxalicum 114-2]|uniref:Uncharacterized protein n=1 Tax=Penicillium oxalicum (strain 114-2 / CGMCC 5302) TaxID=933388 RepID=S7ZGG7_PENO1|nr:hypothetical protein PDE_04288 [Penicillium oxalicum 114-2]
MNNRRVKRHADAESGVQLDALEFAIHQSRWKTLFGFGPILLLPCKVLCGWDTPKKPKPNIILQGPLAEETGGAEGAGTSSRPVEWRTKTANFTVIPSGYRVVDIWTRTHHSHAGAQNAQENATKT